MRDLTDWRGCAPPHDLTVEGDHVRIVPFDAATHGHALWDALGGAGGINALLRYFPNADFTSPDDFVYWLETARSGGWKPHVFLDKATGTPLGMASYMRIDAANGSAEIGSVAHGAAMARTPAATEAHYLMARHLFDDLGYRRYEWKCHNDNMASKRAATRLGFTFEGIFRQHLVAKGANRDTAWYSIIDSEWPLVGAAMEEWLEDGNFDATGQQVRSLEAMRDDLARKAADEMVKA
jgi:RimJ/RimL family protein N-acetyltransferase